MAIAFLLFVVVGGPFALAIFVAGLKLDKPAIAAASAIVLVSEFVWVVALISWFDDCFTVLEPTPKSCEPRETGFVWIATITASAWAALGGAGVWTVWHTRAAIVAGTLVVFGAAVVLARPDRLFREDLDTSGVISFVSCPVMSPCYVWSVRADGEGDPVRGPRTEDPYVTPPREATSPDGLEVVQIRENKGRPNADGAWGLYLTTGDPPEARFIAPQVHGSVLAWSPDSRFVAFEQGFGWQLSVIDTVSGEITEISDDQLGGATPAWSPDGRFLTFVTISRYGECEVRVARRDGKAGEKLTDSAGCPTGSSMVWTPE